MTFDLSSDGKEILLGNEVIKYIFINYFHRMDHLLPIISQTKRQQNF